MTETPATVEDPVKKRPRACPVCGDFLVAHCVRRDCRIWECADPQCVLAWDDAVHRAFTLRGPIRHEEENP